MFRAMQPTKRDLICLVGVLMLGTALRSLADAKVNPYQPIIERNAFGLKPPPPPTSDVPPPPPPVPLAKVTLTGITSLFGQASKRALLEIVENEPGKAAVPRKPILREGEHDGSIEVISIDIEKNIVRIRNGGVETNLTFEVQKSAPGSATAAAPPPVPVAAPTASVVAPNPAGGVSSSSPSAPILISRNSSGSTATSSGSGVFVTGNNQLTAYAGGSAGSPTLARLGTVSPSAAGYPSAAGTGYPSAANPGDQSSAPAVPGRPLRTENTIPQKPLSQEEVWLRMETLRERYKGTEGNPFTIQVPQTPLTPLLQGN